MHRVVTDQARITRKYVEDNVAAGLGKEAYVELVGIVVAVFSIDEFHRALGLDLEKLPAPEPGEISRYRPAMLTEDMGFVPTVPPDGAVGEEADLWPGGHTANVLRALSLVPDALREYKGIFSVQYLPFGAMRSFDHRRGARHQPHADRTHRGSGVRGQRVFLLNWRARHDAPCERVA